MQHLTPVGLSKDGTKLVLRSDSGEEFSVTLDHKLRTTLRGDQSQTWARTATVEKKMESALRPRDIQMRIRAGESAEAVAAAAGTTVEAIMPFAGPVIAERQHIADFAQKSSIRRRAGEAPVQHRTLGDAAAAYFSPQHIKTDDVEWDAWRRDDGRWTLVATWEAGADVRTAHFTFDQRGRYSVADDDTARELTGEAQPAAPAQPAARRLSSVPPAEDELPLGDGELGTDAIALVRERDLQVPTPEPAAPVIQNEEQTADLSEYVEQARAASEAPDVDEPETEQPREQAAEHADEPAPAPPKRKGRASVPSWDEIMFGGGKPE